MDSDSRFKLQNSENEVKLLNVAMVIGKFTLCCQAPDS